MGYQWATDAFFRAWMGIAGADNRADEAYQAATSYIEQYTGIRSIDYATPLRTKTFPTRPPYVTMSGKRLLLFEWVQEAGDWIPFGFEDGSELNSSQFRRLVHPRSDTTYYGFEIIDTSPISRWGDRGDVLSITWYWGVENYHGLDSNLQEIAYSLGQYFYGAAQGGSGGQSFLASRQTGLVVQQDAIPERIMSRLKSYRYGP